MLLETYAPRANKFIDKWKTETYGFALSRAGQLAQAYRVTYYEATFCLGLLAAICNEKIALYGLPYEASGAQRLISSAKGYAEPNYEALLHQTEEVAAELLESMRLKGLLNQ